MNISAFSTHSILFGHITPQELVQSYVKMGYSHAAITDIYMLSGISNFVTECRKQNIKPIIGITIRLKYKILNKEYIGYATCLFKTKEGYLQFIKHYNNAIIKSKINEYIFNYDYFKDIEDIFILIGNKDSLLDSIIQHNLKENEQKILLFIKKLQNIYGTKLYFSYSEINNIEEENIKNYLHKIEKKIHIQLLPSYPIVHNDLQDKETEQDALYKHITLIAIQNKTKFESIITNNNKKGQRIQYYGQEYSIIPKENLEKIYKKYNSYKNLETIINSCKFNNTFSEIMPLTEFIYDIPNAYKMVKEITLKELEKILTNTKDKDKRQKYKERYTTEINMYDKINIYNVLYIVYDLVKWAKENHIHIGAGRGSCVGSLIIYLLGVTKVDPLQHELLFERFINEDRYTIADIDIDVCNTTRYKLLDYLTKKYSNEEGGEIHLIHIVVFLRFMEKSSFKDVMRVTGNFLNFQETNNLMRESDKIFNDDKTIVQKFEILIKRYDKENQNIVQILEAIKNKQVQDLVTEITNINSSNSLQNYDQPISTNLYENIIKSIKIIEQTIYFNENIKQSINKIPQILIIELENYQSTTDIEENIQKIINYITKKLNNIQQVIHNSKKFKNCIRGTSIHAGGILITNKPYNHYFPVHISRDNDKGTITTQFDLDMINKNNIFKFDLLGLETILLIQTTLREVYSSIKAEYEKEGKVYQKLDNQESREIIINNQEIDIDEMIKDIIILPQKYQSIYNIIRQGYHRNIFQLDRQSTANIANRLMFDQFNDIVSLTALIRPGSSELVESYIKNKRNFKQWIYENQDNPDFNIVKSTFGVLAFQEQITQIAMTIANFTPKEADFFRYAIGKKKVEFIKKYKEKFFLGCSQNNIPSYKIEKLYNRIEKFASYAFNKSHAVAYSYITLQTMYLKRYYPFTFSLTSINIKIKEKSKTRATCIELVMAHQNVFFIYPEINYKHIKFSYLIQEDNHYVFISLLSIYGITEQFTTQIQEFNSYNTQKVEEAIKSINPNKKILQDMFSLQVFRRHEINVEEMEKDIESNKKRGSTIKLQTPFEELIVQTEKLKSTKHTYSLVFTKKSLQKLIEKEYEYYENSYIKLNIASLIKLCIRKDNKQINNLYIVTEKTKYKISLTNFNLPFLYFKVSLDLIINAQLCDIILKVKIPDTKSSIYTNITNTIIENNKLIIKEEYLLNYFNTEFVFNNQRHNINDKIWYTIIYNIDKSIIN